MGEGSPVSPPACLWTAEWIEPPPPEKVIVYRMYPVILLTGYCNPGTAQSSAFVNIAHRTQVSRWDRMIKNVNAGQILASKY